MKLEYAATRILCIEHQMDRDNERMADITKETESLAKEVEEIIKRRDEQYAELDAIKKGITR